MQANVSSDTPMPIQTRVTNHGADEAGAVSPCLRVFIVDDHTIVREGLRNRIGVQNDMKVVGEADCGRQALERIYALEPPQGEGLEVVLMDLSLPDSAGTDITSRIKQRWPDTQVLAFSMHEDRWYARSMFSAGASGYIVKRSCAESLLTAIRTVASGKTYVDPLLGSDDSNFGVRQHGQSLSELKHTNSKLVVLSEREREVLKALAQGATTKEVGEKLFLSAKTVDTYKTRSMRKLGLHSRVDLVRYAVYSGWLSNAADDSA